MPSPWKVSPSPSLSACTSFLNERSIDGLPADGWGPNYITTRRLHMRGQPERDDREGDQDHQPDQVGDDERDYAFENRGESDVLHHAFDHENDHSDRGMN